MLFKEIWFYGGTGLQKKYLLFSLNWSTFKKYDFWKKLQVKIMSRSEVMLVVFSLWCHFWETIKIGANFLCNTLDIELKDSLNLANIFVSHLENWYKMRKIIA